LKNKMKELESIGFLLREQIKIDGKFKGYNYILNDVPLTGKPLTGKPLPGNQQQSNNSINTKYNINTIKSNNIPNTEKFDPLVNSAFGYFIVFTCFLFFCRRHVIKYKQQYPTL